MRKITRFTQVCIVMAMLVLAPGVAAQDSGEGPCAEVNGIYDTTTMNCAIQAGLTINMDYPWHFTEYYTLKAAVDQLYNGLAGDFAANYAEVIATAGPGATFGPWSLYVSYEMFNTQELMQDGVDLPLSYAFTISEYTGGAHPNSFTITLNHDLQTGINLALDDLFIPGVDYLPTLSQLAQQSLIAQQGEYADADWIAQGAAPDPLNFNRFVITLTDLVIFFDSYQVAPYAMGPQTVYIPLTQISTLLNPRFVN